MKIKLSQLRRIIKEEVRKVQSTLTEGHKEVQDLVPGDRFLYHSDHSGKDYWLVVTSAPFQSKQDPNSLTVFTDMVGVLSSVTLPKGSTVELA